MQDNLLAALVAVDGELAAGLGLYDIPDVGGNGAVHDAVLGTGRVLVADLEHLDAKGALGSAVVLKQREAIVVVVDPAALGSAVGVVVVIGELVARVARLQRQLIPHLGVPVVGGLEPVPM